MWQTVLGHTSQIAQLRHAVSTQHLAPAYLFAGPSGVGKRLVALCMAQHLLCDATEDAPCGQCRHCVRIASGAHPDVFVVAPADDSSSEEIAIDQIRALQGSLQFHALEGARKVAIIDRADRMHPAAANACLKILEEPPSRTHFLLLSAAPHRLLPTIRSRCQTIHFGPLDMNVIATHLTAQGMDPAEARQRAILAEGSLGRALAYPSETVADTLTDLHGLLGTGSAARVSSAKELADAILTVAERWAADGAWLPWRLQLVGLLWRDALARASHADLPPSLPATESLLARLQQRAPSRLTRELDATLHVLQDTADTTLNKQLCCEALLFKLAAA